MYLNPGETLGPFRIQGQLGAGGMGTVYKAIDTRLNRTVAIKVLTGVPSLGEELRRRFEREAQAIAALNHPHICVVHDVGEEGAIPYIVMEYLEGETLASRLLKGPLPFKQVLQYAAEIADALDTAHRAGVMHRDLKPANIVLTKGGAKLLDFGIAKLLSDAPEDSLDATTRLNLTQRGTIVGTLQYMAPEQVQGTAVDSRTDIFSFGAVVYEMATGRKAFAGASQTELTVAILEHHPPAMSSVQPATPAALERVVSICLAKAPEDRWQSARDAALLLRAVVGGPVLAASSPHSRHARRWAVWSMALVTTLALIAAGVAFTRLGARRTATIAFTIPAPAQASPRMQLDPFTTISPDGRHVAFTLRNPAGGGELWVRSLDSFEARVLPGTEGAFIPFWSADSTEIAFFTDTDQQLKAVAHTGGTVRVLCAAAYPLGGTWNRDGTILFSAATTSANRSGTATSGVHRVSQAGGVAAPVVVSGRTAPERGLLRRYGANESWPQFLPDGRHFIYLDRDTNTIRLRTLDSDQSAALLTADSQAVYAAPGHLLFVRQGSLMAQPFDAAGLKLSGEPFRVLENVRFDTSLGGAVFSASANGTLAYSAGLIQGPSRAAWVNHAGQPGERLELATISLSNRLSPDGRQLVQDRVTPGEVADLWVVDLMPTRKRAIDLQCDRRRGANLVARWCAGRVRIQSGWRVRYLQECGERLGPGRDPVHVASGQKPERLVARRPVHRFQCRRPRDQGRHLAARPSRRPCRRTGREHHGCGEQRALLAERKTDRVPI